MKTRTNMSTSMLRISHGYVVINGYRVYCELWLATASMEFKLQIFNKNLSASWKSNTNWHYNGQHLYCWFSVFGGEPGSVNEVVDGLVRATGLKLFEEPRKWLTEREKGIARLLALELTDIGGVERMLKTDVCELPQAFHEYVKQFKGEYYDYIRWCDAREKRLNTIEGLRDLLWHCKHHDMMSWSVSQAIHSYCIY